MSPMSTCQPKKGSRFTRGEKCIFVHLVLTFSAVLALVVVYGAHLWAVPHPGAEMFRVARRSALAEVAVTEPLERGDRRVGVVRAGARRVCGALSVRRRWALAPAHCVAARAHPELAPLLPDWRIKFLLQSNEYEDSAIIRGIVHSRFNRDDFNNNIGLFELLNPIFMDDLVLSDGPLSTEFLRRHASMALVGWAAGAAADVLKEHAVKPLPPERCREYLSPVVELRSHEFCVHSDETNVSLEHGAVVTLGDQVKGLATWGDKTGHLPLIVLDIGFYKDWIENTVI